MRARPWRVVALAVLALLATGCEPESLQQPPQLRPHLGAIVPDPAIIAVGGGRFEVFGTTSDGMRRLPQWGVDEAEERGLDHPQEALSEMPSWAHQNQVLWAPAVIRAEGRYVLYFAARHRSVAAERPGWCIAVATAAHIDRPFVPRGRPLLCRVGATTPSTLSRQPATGQGAIDPSAYRAPNGRLFLHFKALDRPWQLWGVRLSADGLSTTGDARGLVRLDAQVRSAWEYSDRGGHTIIENPAMDRNPGSPLPYYLYYSGGDFRSASYATGIAGCETPMGPCRRLTVNQPWMSTRPGARGPGGLSITRDAAGQRWVAYHAYPDPDQHASTGRHLHVEPLVYDGPQPVLLRRPVRGAIESATVEDGNLLVVTGTADDPDLFGADDVHILLDGELHEDRYAARGRENRFAWRERFPPGTFQICVDAPNEPPEPPTRLGCRTLVVQPPPTTTTTTTTTTLLPPLGG